MRQDKTFEDLRLDQQFTNGTGCTFVKTGERDAVVIEAPDYPQLVGARYAFGLYNSVRLADEEAR